MFDALYTNGLFSVKIQRFIDAIAQSYHCDSFLNRPRYLGHHQISRSEDSRYDHRLHGLLLVCQGFSCPEVSDILGDSPRIIEYWVNDFNNKGFAGLREGKRTGRPSSIDEAILSN